MSSADHVLVLAWLALAHLAADFVLQTRRMAIDKYRDGVPARRGLLGHAAGVAICLVPFALAFGVRGLWVLVAVAAGHAAIDRSKVVLTRRAEARALAEAQRRNEAPMPEASLGTAWTPLPAGLFIADQLAHALLIAAAWALWLSTATPLPAFADGVAAVLPDAWPLDAFHRAVLVGTVIASLLIVNVRAAALFVAILVHPREAVTGSDEPARHEPPTVPEPPAYTFRLGPLVASAEPTRPTPEPAPRVASPARVGATIGVIERLLIVTFVMTNAQAAIGFVVAAKTLARFRQLDDRSFAEYYLLGTLASVGVAIGSALIAVAALAAP